MAELWALRDGFQLCLHLHTQVVSIELDSKSIVEVFNSQIYANTFISSLIEDCKHMISKIPQTRTRHIFREANRCEDFLDQKQHSNLRIPALIHNKIPIISKIYAISKGGI